MKRLQGRREIRADGSSSRPVFAASAPDLAGELGSLLTVVVGHMDLLDLQSEALAEERLHLIEARKAADRWRDLLGESAEGIRSRDVVSLLEESVRREPARAPCGRETVLVVERNPQLLALIAGYLHDLGYVVLHATAERDALEALEIPRPIDLILADGDQWSGPSGGPIERAARSLHPGAAVVLTHAGSPPALADPDVRLLRKPYRLHTLATCLRSALDSREPPRRCESSSG